MLATRTLCEVVIADCAYLSALSNYVWKAGPRSTENVLGALLSCDYSHSHKDCGSHSVLVPRLLPSIPSLAVRTAKDGKLDEPWGTRLVISFSAYELCCTHVPLAARALS